MFLNLVVFTLGFVTAYITRFVYKWLKDFMFVRFLNANNVNIDKMTKEQLFEIHQLWVESKGKLQLDVHKHNCKKPLTQSEHKYSDII
jgi:ABC-type bacteriocin/lantibiotic exporter with double-glycine peptidase domain